MSLDLDDLKMYLRVDIDDMDSEIEIMQKAAEQYLDNAGVDVDSDNDLVNICVQILVMHWFENRGNTVVGETTSKLDYTLDNIITQLKYTSDSL